MSYLDLQNFRVRPTPKSNSPRALCRLGLILCASLITLAVARAGEPATTAKPASISDKPAVGQSNAVIQIAGELIVSLDAADPSAVSKTWTNRGTMGNFTRIGAPRRSNPARADAGTSSTGPFVPAVRFQGTNDAYRSENPTPATITGDHARSIEVWVHNETLDSTEECLVAWGHRGAPLANMSFNYGSGGGFSAVTHYDEDMSWGDDSPAAGIWHYLVYTYDGKTAKIYDNGVELGSHEFKLATAEGDRMNIAAENSAEGEPIFRAEWEPEWPLTLSGHISIVRVHSGALTPDQVKANFRTDNARFGLPMLQILPHDPASRRF